MEQNKMKYFPKYEYKMTAKCQPSYNRPEIPYKQLEDIRFN